MIARGCCDERGVTAVEFALVLPLFLMLFLGGFDYIYGAYGRSVLIGAMHDAGRASTLEMNNASQTAVDERVRDRVRTVNAAATVTFQRKAYQDFASVGTPEPFVDSNQNGKCDNSEKFDDMNGNDKWDTDQGRSGQGTGSDVVLYSATMIYPTIFNSWVFLNQGKDMGMRAATVLRNQPFSNQVPGKQRLCT